MLNFEQKEFKKVLYFPARDEEKTYVHNVTPGSHLVKTAGQLTTEISDFINQLQPDDGITYLLVNALGAGESWGANVNGDYFPRQELVNNYKTFLGGYVFKDHVNKDPEKKKGNILCAAFNDVMDRVELIIAIINKLAPKLTRRIHEEGFMPDVSMGTKVPYDECSICKNKAQTRADYCDHLKFMMGHVFDDGSKVMAINYSPGFFDLSTVGKGADKSSGTLMKVASAISSGNKFWYQLSSKIAEDLDIEKESDINKEVQVQKIDNMGDKTVKLLRATLPVLKKAVESEPVFKMDLIKKWANEYNPVNAMATLAMNGITLNPNEFQRMILVHMNKNELLNQLENKKMVFEASPQAMTTNRGGNICKSIHVSTQFQDNEVSDEMIKNKSAFMPYLIDRIQRNKQSNSYYTRKNIYPIMKNIAEMYYDYLCDCEDIMNKYLNFACDHRFVKALKPSINLFSGGSARDKMSNFNNSTTKIYVLIKNGIENDDENISNILEKVSGLKGGFDNIIADMLELY